MFPKAPLPCPRKAWCGGIRALQGARAAPTLLCGERSLQGQALGSAALGPS